MQAINTRRGLRKQLLDSKSERLKERYELRYQQADREVKGFARSDKRAFKDGLAGQPGEAAIKGEQGKVNKITKIISGK